jgi:hypothetical protein
MLWIAAPGFSSGICASARTFEGGSSTAFPTDSSWSMGFNIPFTLMKWVNPEIDRELPGPRVISLALLGANPVPFMYAFRMGM